MERTALIYSWLPTIPLNSFMLRQDELDEAKKRLTDLESIFFDADLSTIGKSIYSNPLGREESIFPSYKSHPALAIRDFLKPASELIHIEFNQNTQLSSTTKLLHFMCPELFPIFDRKVCQCLFGSTYQTYKRYNEFVFGLQRYLEIGKEAEYIKQIAKEQRFSPLYIIDLVIFNGVKMSD